MLCENCSAPTIVPNQSENMGQVHNAPPGMDGTIWPHAAVSSAPSPTGNDQQHQQQEVQWSVPQNGNMEPPHMYQPMEHLAQAPFNAEDFGWENSLLMPVSVRPM